MGTRAAAFTAKIKNLQDAQTRLQQAGPSGQSVGPLSHPSGTNNPPNGIELATTLKWFSTTLLNVLKDVPGQPFVMMKNRENDAERMALYPCLDYKGLYSTMLSFIDLSPCIPPSGMYDFGKAYLNTLASLIPFLERDLIDTLPYWCCTLLTVFPPTLHQDIVNVICWHLIPFTICMRRPRDNFPLSDSVDLNKDNYATKSASAILMMVFQYVKDNTAIHRQAMEALMAVKEDLVKDLLCVIAHGTPSARLPAANLLFYYWPSLNPTIPDLKAVINKFNNSESWSPPYCSAPDCAGKGNAFAVKMCLDHTICMSHHQDRPPPGFYCRDCFLTIQRLIDNRDLTPMFQDINHPIKDVSITCEYQRCKSVDKTAVSICFSPDCSSFNGTEHRPTRYCQQCNKINHQSRRTMDHIIHGHLASPWDMEQETQNYLVKAVVSLLQEARPFGSNREQEESHRRTMQVLEDDGDDCEDETSLNERRLLSRYGIWLLVGLSTPNADTNIPTFGHMLSMLFQWFHATAYLPNDKTGTALEKLKSEYIPEWLQGVYKSHPDVFVTCLLPNPPDYARIGGHWDVIMPKIDHIKEGLVRFFCLVPYDVITLEVWEKAMSHWMEVINKEVSNDELPELKNIFSKIFDPDMSPLGFDAREMYRFISSRFKRTLADIQQQALQWLQKLCRMNIHIPMEILFEMFNDGVDTLHKDGADIDPNCPSLIVEVTSGYLTEDEILGGAKSSPETNQVIEEDIEEEPPVITKEELNLICYNLMVDVLNSQMQLQDIEQHVGLLGPYANDVMCLINKMLATPWFEAINKCLVDTVDLDDLDEDEEVGIRSIEDLLVDFLQLCHMTIHSIMPLDSSHDDDDDGPTITVHSNTEMDPKALSAMKKGPGLGQFMAVLTTMQSSAEKARETEDSMSISSQEDTDDSFEMKIEDYTISLQLVYHFLLRNTELVDPDMRYYILDAVRLLALNADVLQTAARRQKKFILHCQEPLLTGVLWHILDGAHSQVAQVAIPIILHSITLPGGADTFWKALDEDFHDEDWRVRFAAVEKVTLIFRFLEEKPIKKTNPIKSVLSHAFCCLIASMDDINVHISQKATLQLGTVHDSAIKILLYCLEYQFDTIPIDRPVILRRLHQLFHCMIERKILTWQFFANRFETLISEIQSSCDKGQLKKNIAMAAAATGTQGGADTISLTSSGHTAIRAKTHQKSGGEASVRSLAASLKYPYKRTISAPAGMGLSIVAKATVQATSSSKGGNSSSCQRQQSVPLMQKMRSAKSLSDSGHQLNKQVSNVGSTGVGGDDNEYVNVAAKTLDLDEIDKESLHLLVFLFMQYLSHPDQSILPPDDKAGKVHSSTKCFHSLFSLIGYNEAERRFQVMPHKIRATPTVNAFFASLPQVLDYNFAIGEHLLLNCILILQKIPFPPRFATVWQNGHTLMHESMLFQGCGFSLWYLEPSLRKNWLMAALVIMYKYDFNADSVLGEKSVGIIRIILHTLASHAHACERYSKPSYGQFARSRDLSQLSINESEKMQDDSNVFPPDDDYEESSEEDEGDPEEDNEEDISGRETPADEIDTEEKVGADPSKSSGSTSSPEKQALLANEINEVPREIEDKTQKVHSPMANLFELLPRPSSGPGSKSAPTPKNHQLTNEGLPAGWTMQLMKNGRTLFIDNTNQITTWIDPRTGRPAEIQEVSGGTIHHHFPMFESPPSPLSLMDVITVGSPVAVDKIPKSTGTNSTSSPVTLASPELPQKERLLPIGNSRAPGEVRRGDNAPGREGILDRVWQAFGGMDLDTVPLMQENTSSEKIQVVASIHRQADDHEPGHDGNDGSEITECYVGHVTHLSNNAGQKKKDQSYNDETMKQQTPLVEQSIQQVDNESPASPKSVTPKTPIEVSQTKPKKSSLKKKPCNGSSEKHDSVNKVEIRTTKSKRKKGRKARKTGTGNAPDPNNLDSMSVLQAKKKRENSSTSLLSGSRDNPLLLKQSALRVGEDSIVDRCSFCGAIKEEYSEDELGHCIIIISTFVNREPSLAAPLLPEILITLTRIARRTLYSWEMDSNTYVPSNSRSVAKQIIRCILHQLSNNGIFSKLFHMEMREEMRQKFFSTIVQCLLDFTDLSPSVPVALFMQEINEKKTLLIDDVNAFMPNLACYFKCVQFEFSGSWNNVFPHSEPFFRRIWGLTGTPLKPGAKSGTGSSSSSDTKNKSLSRADHNEVTVQLPQIESLFHVMTSVLRVPGTSQGNRAVLDPIAKLVSYAIQNCGVKFINLLSICHYCNRSFVKERDKQLITRTAVYELVQALKFKICIPDSNFLLLTNLVLYDAGGELASGIFPDSSIDVDASSTPFNTAACEVMRNHLSDVLDFLADVHTLSKVKSTVKGLTVGLNDDTLGGILKASLSQYLALEISRGNGKDSRTVQRYLPWLFNPPGNTATQGPKEFLDCVAHIRLLSWLLLGAVNHTLKFGANEAVVCQPIPLDASCHIADHIQVILAGFAEQSKTSVVHMCSLFHAFILCQLWTVYLEQTIVLSPPKEEPQNLASAILLDFWGKVTPGILQLVSHSKVLAEMVNLHFLSLMEALMECNSTILVKLMPLWTPVLFAFQTQLPDHVRLRLQTIHDYKPQNVGLDEQTTNNTILVKWLHRLQFKMGQIEMQASNVTQFFTV